jgi:hypothetical protein
MNVHARSCVSPTRTLWAQRSVDCQQTETGLSTPSSHRAGIVVHDYQGQAVVAIVTGLDDGDVYDLQLAVR